MRILVVDDDADGHGEDDRGSGPTFQPGLSLVYTDENDGPAAASHREADVADGYGGGSNAVSVPGVELTPKR